MRRLTVTHETIYRYGNPVWFGEHRLMFRPRDSHDLRLVESGLVIDPPAKVRWYHDVFGNSIAIASFDQSAAELRIQSTIVVDHYGLTNPVFPVEDFARTLPFGYQADEMPDLRATVERGYPDPDRLVDEWSRSFLNETGPTDTQLLLAHMTRSIRANFTYQARDLMGTQTPAETLERRSGTCRDYALLMMEAARSIGLAARFVSGYLYDPALDSGSGGSDGTVGAGATHAWVQVYLPGAGWVAFDPTNGVVGDANCIRVAVARDPAQAVPLQGSFTGDTGGFADMTINVEVRAQYPTG